MMATTLSPPRRTRRPGLIVILALGLAIAGCQPATAPATAPATVAPDPLPVAGVGYVVINAPIAPATRSFFIANVDKLRAAGATEIDLGINSPGGDIDSAQDMVDYMARAHRDGVTFKAYNLGVVASAATYVFLNAQARYAGPRGAFLFHAASLVANGPITSERLHESVDKLDAYERTIRATLIARTHLTPGEAQTYVRRTVVLNADDARRDGVIDAIADLPIPRGARAYMILGRPNRPRTPAAPPEP